jgi:hypothetical protein
MLPGEVSLLEYEKDSTGQGTSRANPRWSNRSALHGAGKSQNQKLPGEVTTADFTGQGNRKTKLKS